jgi:hypothetical protein
VSELRVELVKAEGISDRERWARICRAYDLIASFSLADDPGDDPDQEPDQDQETTE